MFSVSTKLVKKVKNNEKRRKGNLLVCDDSLLFRGTWNGSHYFVLVCRQLDLCMQKKSKAEKHATIVES